MSDSKAHALVKHVALQTGSAHQTAFTLLWAAGVEKQAEELTRLAASLLLFQSVLAGKPAQAFLNLLMHLQKGSPLKLLEHYGELVSVRGGQGRGGDSPALLQ